MSVFQLRSLDYADVHWIFEACQDVDIQRWTLIPRPYSFEDAEWFIENEPGYYVMVIEEIEAEMPVGVVCIHEIDEITREASMGYWVAPWGRGMNAAATAVNLMIETITPEENVHSVVANIAEGNLASQRAIQRAGFSEVEREWGIAREFLVEVMGIKYSKTLL